MAENYRSKSKALSNFPTPVQKTFVNEVNEKPYNYYLNEHMEEHTIDPRGHIKASLCISIVAYNPPSVR